MIKLLKAKARSAYEYMRLPAVAKAEIKRDGQGVPDHDPGIETAVAEAVGWLCRAQDNNQLKDGGVARDYSLVNGWNASYPETTGYIVPTLIDCAKTFDDEKLLGRARDMLDWLVFIQLPGGGFQGGLINSEPVVPVTFNTGQILIGLAAGVAAFGDAYRPAMQRAADWLVETQDDDGCWRSQPTPFAKPGEKAYETHVAWGLIEADRVSPGSGYADAALANMRWAIQYQKENGWFDKCCLVDPSQPLTHTLGYVLRGILEGYRHTQASDLLEASQRTADGLLDAIDGTTGYLPGRLLPDWRPAVSWSCLTGAVQIAHCWLLLYNITGKHQYRDEAFAANAYVRRTVNVNGEAETRGGVKGSFPVNGAYGRFEYLNWACKFFIDANLLEKEVRAQDNLPPT